VERPASSYGPLYNSSQSLLLPTPPRTMPRPGPRVDRRGEASSSTASSWERPTSRAAFAFVGLRTSRRFEAKTRSGPCAPRTSIAPTGRRRPALDQSRRVLCEIGAPRLASASILWASPTVWRARDGGLRVLPLPRVATTESPARPAYAALGLFGVGKAARGLVALRALVWEAVMIHADLARHTVGTAHMERSRAGARLSSFLHGAIGRRPVSTSPRSARGRPRRTGAAAGFRPLSPGSSVVTKAKAPYWSDVSRSWPCSRTPRAAVTARPRRGHRREAGVGKSRLCESSPCRVARRGSPYEGRRASPTPRHPVAAHPRPLAGLFLDQRGEPAARARRGGGRFAA